MSNSPVSAAELPNILQQGHKVIDVRSPREFRAEHVVGAELRPITEFDAAAFCRECGTDTPVYILCQSGGRASAAAKQLETAGHSEAYLIEGGTNAAKAAGVDIRKGESGMSIERQVRIAAGALVVIGALLGLLVHSGFFAIPIFVGSGLVFAGITDTCGMGMMLARMPWNR